MKNPKDGGKPGTNKDKSVKGISNGLGKVAIDDSALRAKSKNLDVLAEYEKTQRKNAANFIVIGKSTNHHVARVVIGNYIIELDSKHCSHLYSSY